MSPESGQNSGLVFDLQNATAETELPDYADFQHWVELALAYNHYQAAELTIRLVDGSEIQYLNAQYRGKDKPTNVLAFPVQLPPEVQQEVPLLGDIVICAPVIWQEAQEQHKPLKAHWAHIVLHGTLHLLGYDHINQEEAQQMESLEVKLLAQLGYPNPYEDID